MNEVIELNLDAIEAAAKAALQEPVSTPFLQKTNSECAEWMRSFYNADAIPSIDRHCTWAWQEQERRNAAVMLELVRRLRAAEALAASRIEQIPTDSKMVAVFSDFRPEHRAEAEEFAEAIKKRCTSGCWTLVAFFPTDADIKAMNDEQMRQAGWVREPEPAADRVTVDAAALRQTLTALVGHPHQIRELQATRGLPGGDNPIDQLLNEFNAWAERGGE